MLTKIRRQDCLAKYKTFPLRSYNYENDEEIFYYPEVYKSYILTLSSKSFKGHLNILGKELIHLIKAINADTLIFLGDTEIAWLYQNNDYKPAKEAQEYLTNNNIGKRFSGALQVAISELPVFIKHLAWLTRCNAALPYFHFIDKRQSIVGNICKYGNLHLDTLNEPTDQIVNFFIANSKFELANNGSCHNLFGKTSAIPGRKTII